MDWLGIEPANLHVRHWVEIRGNWRYQKNGRLPEFKNKITYVLGHQSRVHNISISLKSITSVLIWYCLIYANCTFVQAQPLCPNDMMPECRDRFAPLTSNVHIATIKPLFLAHKHSTGFAEIWYGRLSLICPSLFTLWIKPNKFGKERHCDFMCYIIQYTLVCCIVVSWYHVCWNCGLWWGILCAQRMVEVETWRAGGMVRDGEVRTVWTVACKHVTLCLPKTPHGLPWQRSWVFVVRRR
jgi:hypothetical protein